jgi:hypothetical protein
MIDGIDFITPNMVAENGAIFVDIIQKTTTTDENNKTIINSGSIKLINGLGDNVEMSEKNFIYLAMQNKLSSKNVISPNNENVNYEIHTYSIPKNKMIMKVEGLQKYSDELGIIIYDYEFGPEEQVIKAIKDRKNSSNTVQMWLGRLGTFLMLFVGLALIISPFTSIVEFGDNLPGPLKIFVLPGKLILNLYQTFNLFGSLILTVLMTFLIWSLINYPLISVIIGGLLIGMILYFRKK